MIFLRKRINTGVHMKTRISKIIILLLLLQIPSSVFSQENCGSEEPAFTENLQENIQENLKTRAFSLDFSATILGLSNNGWGLGFTYEQYLAFHSALKVNFAHCTFIRKEKMIPTVNFGLGAEYYPLSRSLDKLYLVIGGAMDFIGYSTDEHEKDLQRNFISVFPEIGWKWQINEYVALDIRGGYKYIFLEDKTKVPEDYKNYLQSGIIWGAGIKIKIVRLIQSLL